MYNEKQKQRYLETLVDSTRKWYENIFETSQTIENFYDKDLYDFTEQQGLTFFSLLNSSSVESLGSICSRIISYVDWALSQNLVYDGVNHFRQITKEERDKCLSIKKMDKYLTEEELNKIVASIPDYTDKFLVLAPWYSIGSRIKEELLYVSDRDIKGLTLTLRDENFNPTREIQIDQNYKDIITIATNMYISLEDSRNKTLIGDFAWKTRSNGNSDLSVAARMNGKFSRLTQKYAKKYGFVLNYNVVRFSAMLHHVKKLAIIKNKSCKEIVFSDDIFDIFDLYQFRTTLPNNKRQAVFWYKFKLYLE